MSSIVLVPDPHLSGVIAATGLAGMLERLGHDVTFVGNELVERAASERGFEVVRLPEPDVSESGAIPHNRSILTRWANVKARRAHFRARLGVDRVLELFSRLNPDLVLADQEMPHIVIPLIGRGISTALVSNTMCTVGHPGMPPLSEYCIPGVGAEGSRAGIERLWRAYRLRRWIANTRNWVSSGGINRITTLKALAREHGFDTERHIRPYEWLFPLNLVSLPTLFTPPEVFEFPYDHPPDTLYLGCMVDETRRADPAEVSPELAKMLDRSATGRRLVYCTFGTYFEGDDSGFMSRVIDALNEMADVDVIIGLGGRGEVGALGTLAPHVLALPWVPQLNVLDAADAAILHAGSGTIAECLYYGVPFVTYPFDVNDQKGSASRSVYHGIGVLGDRESDSASKITSRIRTVLEDPAIRANINAMRHRYREANDPSRLQSFIDGLLARGTTAVSSADACSADQDMRFQQPT